MVKNQVTAGVLQTSDILIFILVVMIAFCSFSSFKTRRPNLSPPKHSVTDAGYCQMVKEPTRSLLLKRELQRQDIIVRVEVKFICGFIHFQGQSNLKNV